MVVIPAIVAPRRISGPSDSAAITSETSPRATSPKAVVNSHRHPQCVTRHIVFAELPFPRERERNAGLGIEATNNDDRSVVVLAGAVLLDTDVDAERAPPHFPLMVERGVRTMID